MEIVKCDRCGSLSTDSKSISRKIELPFQKLNKQSFDWHLQKVDLCDPCFKQIVFYLATTMKGLD